MILAGLLASGGWLRAEATNSTLVQSSVLESVNYFRVSHVTVGLADELTKANHTLTGTNKVVGTVLDLRFADGAESSAVNQSAELFVTNKLPLAILVNSGTRGAAAALAATLREQKAGLVLGGAATGVKPDIAVKVSAEDERIYFANAYAMLTKTNLSAGAGLSATNQVAVTNQPPRRRVSEADLVEARRKGAADPEEELDNSPAPPVLPEKPVVRDPVLARALDLLQGLALVREKHGG
jgi:C-terminal processing protease CtpA/Prc